METVTLNSKEQKRLLVFNELIAGRMTGQEAADVLGLSLRHTRRALADYETHHEPYFAETNISNKALKAGPVGGRCA